MDDFAKSARGQVMPRAISIDCPVGHAKAGETCGHNGHTLCGERYEAFRRRQAYRS